MRNLLWQRLAAACKLLETRRTVKHPARRKQNARLQLELLEDRLVPSNIWYVTSLADTSVAVTPGTLSSGETSSNCGTLPWCVGKAATSGDSIYFDTNVFGSGGTIALTSTLTFAKNIVIDGSNGGTFTPSSAIVLDGSSAPTSYSPIEITGTGSSTLEYLTMTGGKGTTGHGGGMIYFNSSSGTITINNCIATNCSSPMRGGFVDSHNDLVMNSVQISNCSVSNTTASTTTENGGGAVGLVNSGTGSNPSIQATNCTFTNCSAILGGGAIGSQTAPTAGVVNSVINCTFVGCVNNDTVGSQTAPSFTTGSSYPATFAAGVTNQCTVTAAGLPVPNYSISGSFPSGVTYSLNSTSLVITGNNSVAIGGPYTYTIVASNSVGSATQTLVLSVVGAAPSFSDGSTYSNTFYTGYSNTCTIAAQGSPTPTYALASGSTLPATMSLSSSGSLTSTSALAAGTYQFVVTATNSLGSASQTITITASKKNGLGNFGSGANITDGTGSSGVTLTDGTGSSGQGGTSGPQGGGAIEVAGGTLKVQGCVFQNNSATGGNDEGGGAVYVGGGNPTFKDCTFYLNTTNASGGAVNVAGSGTAPIFTNCQFTDNSTGTYTGTGINGGAVDVASGTAVFTQCTFNGNTTTGTGGAVEVGGGTLTITNCNFLAGNSSGSSGSAIYTQADTVVENTTITGSSASVSGAGIYATGVLTILNSYFTNNQVPTGAGAAIYITTGVATILNTTFYGNTAGTSGGAIYSAGSNLTIVNDTITGNSASTGAGLEMDSASILVLLNDIIAGNSGSNPDIDNTSSGSLTVNNSLIGNATGNSITDGTNGNVVAPTSTGLTSLAQNGASPYPLAQGSSLADPSSNNPTPNQDQTYDQSIQLSPGSPGVGSGTNITTLSTAVTSGATTIVVASSIGFAASNLAALPPLAGQTTDAPYFTLEFMDSSGVASDPVQVESINGNTLTLVTGTFAAHAAGDSINLISDEVHESTNNPVYPNMGALEISNNPATSLVFTIEPPTTPIDVGTNFTVVLTAYNPAGDAAPSFGFLVTLTLSSGGVTYAPVAAVNGVATFSTISVATPGTYTLIASGGGLTQTSTSFTITPPVGLLVFTPSPASEPPAATTAGTTFSTAVEVETSAGASVGAGAVVTLYISSNTVYYTPSSATYTATASASTITGTTNSSGTFTFSNLSVDWASTSYTLKASATDANLVAGWTASGTSTSFKITAAAPIISYVSSPSTSYTAGPGNLPSFTVQVADKYGNPYASTAASIQNLSSQTTLTGGTTIVSTNASGLATFSNLFEEKVGTYNLSTTVSYTLTGSPTSSLSTTQPGSYTITAAAASKISFTSQPATGLTFTAGQTLTTTTGSSGSNVFTVTVTDTWNNPISGASVNLGISPSALLYTAAYPSGTSSLTNSTIATGIASFSALNVQKTGTYHLTATSGSLSATNYNTFTIVAGAPTYFSFANNPTTSTAGSAIGGFTSSSPVAVQIEDQYYNGVPNAAVTMSINQAPGSTYTLLGTTTSTTNGSGLAMFGTLIENFAYGSYTLTAAGKLGSRLDRVNVGMVRSPSWRRRRQRSRSRASLAPDSPSRPAKPS